MVKAFLPTCFISVSLWSYSIALEDNSKAYGVNSKGYGDRTYPYKKA